MVTKLAGLTALQYLYLYNNQIHDIAALGQLTHLHVLSLYSNQISNIDPLSGLTRLDWLYLSNNQISNIAALSNLSALQYLLLDRNQISDLTALTNLTQLKTLFIYSNAISNIDPLSGLIALKRLHLSGNQISNLSALADLTVLEWLLLGGNQISDLTPLGPLTSLQLLDLNINNISDISPLAPLVTLQTLYIGYNQISDISPLTNLTALQTLLLQKNQISHIAALANLTALQMLQLHYNQIVNIAALHHLTQAVEINLSQNSGIVCSDLDALEATLGSGIVIRPAATCPGLPLVTSSCHALLQAQPTTVSGTYFIDPDDSGPVMPFEVYCDMTTQGGGWTLVANHSDGLTALIASDTVTPTQFTVLKQDKWLSIRDNMTSGMMFKDENGKFSTLSKAKLDSGNCISIDDATDLSKPPVSPDTGSIWHSEASGCSLTGLDYSFINLSISSTSRGSNYLSIGSALYQLHTKFDIWPYNSLVYSGAEQDQMLYFVK